MNPRFRAADSPSLLHAEPDRSVAYDCTVCGRSFSFLSSLSQHMRRHTGSRPYKCPYCPHRASQKGNLKVHIRTHKLSMLISPSLQEEEVGDNGNTKLGVNEGLEATPTKSISTYKGEMNGKTFGRSLKREKRRVMQWLRCRLCGHEAQREDQLLSHIEKVHITTDPEQCGSLAEAEGEDEGESIFTCELCSKSFSQASLLQVHRRKHCTPCHSCSVCGRSFSQVWFLKSHMRTHSKSRALAHGRPTTQYQLLTNGVSQDPETTTDPGSTCLYELCTECGHIFHSRESLKVHIQVHNLSRAGQKQCDQTPSENDHQSPAAKRSFMEYLFLQPVVNTEKGDNESSRLGYRVTELNPVCSVQAWQLATRGHLIKSVSGSEASTSADMLDQGAPWLLIPKGPERRQGRRNSMGGSGNSTAESPKLLSDTEYLPCSRVARRSSNIKPSECFECGKVFRNRRRLSVHIRTHRRDSRSSGGEADSGSPSPSSTSTCSTQRLGERAANSRAAKSTQQLATEEKLCTCSQCDYITTTSSDFLLHVHCMHPCSVAVLGNGCPSLSPHTIGDTTASFSRMKNDLLHRPASCPEILAAPTAQPACTAHPQAPIQSAHTPADMETAEARRAAQSGAEIQEQALDLCMCLDGGRASLTPSAVQGVLPCHQCCYCSYSTCWLEVLWMHQSIAHRISSSTVTPCWAPRKMSRRTKEGFLVGRRTGPPPALDGKECPPLAMVARSQRTSSPAANQNPTAQRSLHMSSQIAGQASPGEPNGVSRTQESEEKHRGISRAQAESHSGLGSVGVQVGLGSAKVLEKSSIVQASGFNIESIKPCKAGFPKNPCYIQSTNAPQEGTVDVALLSQKQDPKMPDASMDILSFLKQCNSHDPAALYHSWSSGKLQLPHRDFNSLSDEQVEIEPNREGIYIRSLEKISGNRATSAYT
ncbi:zinc finger protein 516 isoform X2 [Electrophorus electricus]|uniref:zinc finger protein 516 isoform X2 n=1 Tax=Electrophorus electricus TaxID=8005 RepID=UPI0015D0B290|nr:zinc finger protein 516 isoform X2 [Electrophorus electricus]